MPKPTKGQPRSAAIPDRTLIIDNGAYTLKAGFCPNLTVDDQEALKSCHTIPNALARTRDRRTYIASQLDTQISDWAEAVFRRPVERGQLVNWEAQKAIWDFTFFDQKTAASDLFIQDATDTTLVLTEAPNTLPVLQKNADEIIMEEWGFGAYSRCIGPSLNAFNDIHTLMGDPARGNQEPSTIAAVECCLVVDSGYSNTTVTPLYNSRPIQRGIRRLDYGGKHLTNLLKELVSTRHYDLHQDTHLVNDIKEKSCFVSQSFNFDMDSTKNGKVQRSARPYTPPDPDNMDLDKDQTSTTPDSLLLDYILPDGVHIKHGYTRPHRTAPNSRKRRLDASSSPPPAAVSDEVVMTLGNERFTVPEIIFSPTDIGSKQAGLPELVMQSLSTLPPAIQASMLANILVVGGNAKIPGFVDRLQSEIRKLARVECVVRVKAMENPITSTWLGGARMASNRDIFKEVVITKQQYQEHGSAWAARKFAGNGLTFGVNASIVTSPETV